MPETPLSPRPFRAAAVGTVAALALSLAPGVATAAEGRAPASPSAPTTSTTSAATTGESAASAGTAGSVRVRMKVGREPWTRVSAKRGILPIRLLRLNDAGPDKNDRIIVKRNGRKVRGDARRLRPGTKVRLVRVTKPTRFKRVKVKQRTVTKRVTSLKPGRRKVVAKGRPAVHRVKVKRIIHNGKQVNRKVMGRKVVRKAKPRRVKVGRKPYSVPGADHLNWGGLARCESGGNPRAVNPAGYYGLYQFNVATWRSVGGSGMPHRASAGQQTYRAKLLYKSRGRQPWPYCGRFL